MKSCFVLVNCDENSESYVLEQIKEISCVTEAKAVKGHYDIVVKMEAATSEIIRENIYWKLHKIAKIRSLLSLLSTSNS